MGLVQYDGGQEVTLRTFYFTGTDTLQEGYLLCYDTAATTTNADPKLRLGTAVVKPATAHLAAFAGVVAGTSAGKVGPTYVDVILPSPGTAANVFTETGTTALTSFLKPKDASYAADGVTLDGTVFGVTLVSNGTGSDVIKLALFK